MKTPFQEWKDAKTDEERAAALVKMKEFWDANPVVTFKYVTYDYETPGEPNNFWHIYSTDTEPDGIDIGDITIVAPETEEMHQAIRVICTAIDAAIKLSIHHPFTI